jgi:hypothetical protein
MALQSKLLKDDSQLQACLVSDPAHVMLGANGDHVSRIQIALAILDRSRISPIEINRQQYGASTAQAVLAYKTKRSIINHTYETQADNIVGKMTIAALDTELLGYERRSRYSHGCGDSGGYAASQPVVLASVQSFSGMPGSATAATPTFPKKLDILLQITSAAAKAAGNRHLNYLLKTIELYKPFDMDIVSSVTAPPDAPFPYLTNINPSNQSDIGSVRAAAGAARSAHDVLRIIVCQFEPSWGDWFATTEAGAFPNGDFYQAFVLINANSFREDRCTVAHEMIHAADLSLTKDDHDKDPNNVFSDQKGGPPRTILSANYAEIVSKGYFAKAK